MLIIRENTIMERRKIKDNTKAYKTPSPNFFILTPG